MAASTATRAWRWIAVLLLACACATTSVAKPIGTMFRETWTTRQELPHNQINAIVQTPDGYLWFATWEGLVRYNGLEFQVFDRRNVPELRDNGIRSLRVSADGALVMGTSRGGVTILDRGRWRTYGRREGLTQDEVMDAALDSRGRLWAATESAGMFVLDGAKVTRYRAGAGLPSDIVYGLLPARDGSIWVATAGGIARFYGNQPRILAGPASGLPAAPVFRVEELPDGGIYAGTEAGAFRLQGSRFVPLSPLLPRDGVASFARDHAGALWIGTVSSGLLRLDRDGLERFDSRQGLPNNRVPSLFVDREGSVWAGTNGGLLRLRDAPFTTYGSEQGLSDDYVRAVIPARGGGMWIGTSRGLNLWRNGVLVRSFTRADGLPSDSIMSLLEDPDGTLWVGTYTAGVLQMRGGRVIRHLDSAHGLTGSNQVRALLRTGPDTLWIGTSRGLVRLQGGAMRHFGVEDGLPRDYVMALHQARNGDVWVGTADGAVRIAGDRAQPIRADEAMDARDILGFADDEDGTVWMASDRGLLRYRNGRLALLGLRQGMPVDTIFQVVDDRTGHFWLSSNRGVLRVRRADVDAVLDGRRPTLNVDQFTEVDGLASAQCNGTSGPSAVLAPDGRVWVATARGAAVVDPAALQGYTRELPPVVIERVRADDRDLRADERLELPAGTRKLDFQYAGLSFRMPRLLRYRHKLEGVDAGWVDNGTRRLAQYTNLAPGHYRFLVSVSAPGLGQDWSPGATMLDVVIAPYLWQRAWFLPACIALAGLLVVGVFRWRTSELARRAGALEALVQSRTHALREQTDRLIASDAEKSQLLERIREQADAFERQAREDALTGLANRRHGNEVLAAAQERTRAAGRPLSFALFDVDHFKRINDGFSHQAGDAALVQVANVLRRELGTVATVARWGGEEFAAAFEGIALDDARRACERARQAVERIDCAGFAPGWTVTVSAGVVERQALDTHEHLIRRADDLLYDAKRGGRNRIAG